jgi:hypothetical protein
LAELSQRRLPQLADPHESLAELVKRRQELLVEARIAAVKLALRQEQDRRKQLALLAELQQYEIARQELRRERMERR